MTATHGEGAYGNATGVTTPTAHKMAQVTEFAKTTTANVIRPGVLYNGTASLVAGKANMSYDVLPFSIATQRSATSGVMKWANDGTVNVVTTAAPGSNSRIDVVYAWHREYALDGTDSNPVIGVVQGTAAASPTVPSLAAFPGAVELARITVPAGVTATNSGTTFTQTAPFTSVDASPVPFRTKTEMDVWSTALTGQWARDLSSDVLYRWNGAAWKGLNVGLDDLALYRVATGTNAFNSTSYADLSVGADLTALSTSIVKRGSSAETDLLVTGVFSAESGAALTATIGFRIGSTDYDAGFQRYNSGSRQQVSFLRRITGVADGTHAVKPRFKVSASTLSLFSGDDFVSYRIQEVPVS